MTDMHNISLSHSHVHGFFYLRLIDSILYSYKYLILPRVHTSPAKGSKPIFFPLDVILTLIKNPHQGVTSVLSLNSALFSLSLSMKQP